MGSSKNMPTVVIAVISFAAFATGAVVIRRRLGSQTAGAVHPVELLLVVIALAGVVLLRRPHYPVTHFFLYAAVMFIIGGTIARVTLAERKRASGGTREFEDFDTPALASPWKRWINFSRAVGDYEFRLFLLACYLVVVGPIAVTFRIFRTEPVAASAWTSRSDTPGLDAARRPF